MSNATIYIEDENSRSRSNPTADPGSGHQQTGYQAILNITQLASLRKRHVFLNEYSDEIIISTPIDTLLKLESTSIKLKNLEKAKDIDDKLTGNRDNLPDTIIQVEKGVDNRWDKLHDARFLPGMGGSAVKTWLKAREVMGRGGHAPIATYDMGSVGLAGYVTPKGWLEIHDPGSSNLSLRQFSINNCGKRTMSRGSDNMDDDMADVMEVGEFKCALRVLREAMTFVHPWNKSVATLEGFLIQANYCSTDLSGIEKQATILSQFVDYVLRENSNRWRGQESFLTIGDLKSSWESFFGGRPQSILAKTKNQKPGTNQLGGGGGGGGYSHKQGQFQGGSGQGRVNVPAGLWKDDICVMWNIGKCLKPPGLCYTKGGKQLRHVCNHRPDPARPAVACGANHSAFFYLK